MAVYLARSLVDPSQRPDLPDYTPPTTASFPDVPTSAWNYKDVEYIKSQSVTGGYPDGDYHPEYACTRDQMAVFIGRAFTIPWGGRVIGGVNLLKATTDPGYLDPMDDFFHGTMVSGTIASMDTTYRGIAPAANIVGVKVLDNQGNGYSSDVIAGIEWCVQNRATYGIKVINMSLGDPSEWTSHESCDQQPEGVAVTDAFNAGILVVCAAGNGSYTHGVSLPGCASDAISVGATCDGDPSTTYVATPVDTIASYSDRGELMTMFAPGTWMTAPAASVLADGEWTTEEGTSFASPCVAGGAAVLLSMNDPNLSTPDQLRARLTQTGVQIVDPATGVAAPRLNLASAINPPTSGPDLVATTVSAATGSGFVGDPVNLSLTVKNQGNASSAACQALVVLSSNTVISPQDYVLATVDVPALGAGASYSPTSLAGMIPAMNGGTYYVGAFVDSTYAVPELDETNNAALNSTTFTVFVPSSHVSSASIPSTMKAGQSYPVSIVMVNDGTTDWTPGTYTLASTGPDGNNIWSVPPSSLQLTSTVAQTQPHTFTFNVTAPAAGTYPCFWRMKKGSTYFGETATGATSTLMLNDTTMGQDYPAAGSNYVAFMDYKSGQCTARTACPRCP